MAEQQLERSMLDGKDREQLHAIAGAMGIKGVTRLRKADLVDAILEAASGNGAAAANGATNGAANGARKATKATKATKTAKSPTTDDGDAEPAATPARRAVRSKRASELESEGDLAALAAEEDALAGGDEPEVAPRPIRRTSSTSSSAPAAEAETTTSGTATTEPAGGDAAAEVRRWHRGPRRWRHPSHRGSRVPRLAWPQLPERRPRRRARVVRRGQPHRAPTSAPGP